MDVVSRIAAVAAAVLGCTVLAACGGSVADADRNSGQAASTAAGAPPSTFCMAASASSDAIRPLNGLAAGGPQPADLTGTVNEVRRTGAELVRVSPDEIRADVERTVQAVNLQLDALIAHGGDIAELSRDPALVAQLSSPDLAQAGDRYRSYVGRTCNPSGAPRTYS